METSKTQTILIARGDHFRRLTVQIAELLEIFKRNSSPKSLLMNSRRAANNNKPTAGALPDIYIENTSRLSFYLAELPRLRLCMALLIRGRRSRRLQNKLRKKQLKYQSRFR